MVRAKHIGEACGFERAYVLAAGQFRDEIQHANAARSIWASWTVRTRHPSESRICLTALPPGALLSRTRMPTCGAMGVGLVLTVFSIRQDGSEKRRIKGLRRIGQCVSIDFPGTRVAFSRRSGMCLIATLSYWPTTRPLPEAYFCRPVPSQKTRYTDGRREASLPVKKIWSPSRDHSPS